MLYGVVGKDLSEEVIFEQRSEEDECVNFMDVIRTWGGESNPAKLHVTPLGKHGFVTASILERMLHLLVKLAT